MKSSSERVLSLVEDRLMLEASYKSERDDYSSWIQNDLPKLRDELGLTQQQLADILGVKLTTISKIENDHLVPGLPILRKLQAYLKERTQ